MKLNRAQSLLKTGRMQESLIEHRAIVKALLQRNPEQAASAMRAHISNGLQAAS